MMTTAERTASARRGGECPGWMARLAVELFESADAESDDRTTLTAENIAEVIRSRKRTPTGAGGIGRTEEDA